MKARLWTSLSKKRRNTSDPPANVTMPPSEIETDDIESRMFDLTALRMQLALG